MDQVPAVVPNFVIVGAPKCGTTSLFAYLSTHPAISPPSRKEPFFWCPDVPNLDQVVRAADYERLWPADEGKLKFEATTAYLRSNVAVPAIAAASPDTKFIVMLRNPAEMVAAFHSELVKRFQEDVGDFEKAWRLQEKRARGMLIPRECINPDNLQYERVCALGDQMDRLFQRISRVNMKVILFDDLKADPRSVYLDVLAFLKLADDGRQMFERANPNKRLNSVRLATFHRNLPSRLGRFYSFFRSVAGRLGVSPSTLINRLNVTEAPRPALRPAFRNELIEIFRSQVDKLETLLQRDLARWKTPAKLP